ncbi:uncharacterized protein [Macrobrachium rosenbergii]|uniref:uncharacterized protein n=1 Tax=Macrobrachium rosenbergii TaxID=79674 RepID=UPI0034D7853A
MECQSLLNESLVFSSVVEVQPATVKHSQLSVLLTCRFFKSAKMRVFLIVTLTAFLVGSAHAQTQRPRSRLSQMFNNLVDDMNDVASRIGHGFLRTLNGPGSASRERPIVPRQQNQINGPARQQDENAIAPNDPAVRPSPGSLRQRPRLSFRQFVDGVMSGISNLMPRLRRRVFSRHNNRAGQRQQQ